MSLLKKLKKFYKFWKCLIKERAEIAAVSVLKIFLDNEKQEVCGEEPLSIQIKYWCLNI